MGGLDKEQERASSFDEALAPPQTKQDPRGKAMSGAQADMIAGSLIGAQPPQGMRKLKHVGPAVSEVAAHHDFGEQVVGSSERAQIHAPWNLTDTEAIATFSVSGPGFALASNPTLTLLPTRLMKGPDVNNIHKLSPIVTFRPGRAGSFEGALTITTQWLASGQTDTQTVALRGRARELTQAPTLDSPDDTVGKDTSHRQQPQATTPQRTEGETEKRGPGDSADDGALDVAGAKLRGAAGLLAQEQKRGAALASAEALSYQRQIAKSKRSIWWDLVELALTIGTAGIARHITTAAGAFLSKKSVESFRIGGEATFDTESAGRFSEFTADAVKEGLKLGGKAAIAKFLPGAPTSDEGGNKQEAGGFGHSTNPRIDFFSEQERVLNLQQPEYEVAMATAVAGLRPLLRTDPASGVKAIEAMTDRLHALTADTAAREQANASATSWATAVARMSLGTEKLVPKAAGAAAQATRMDALRPAERDGAPTPADGVLEIYIRSAASPTIERAMVKGVSQEIADRVGTLALAELKMPIRFVLGWQDATPMIVTRDEAGRVRIEGATRSEPEAMAAMHRTIESLLARTLAQQGIPIESDDATGRGDQVPQ